VIRLKNLARQACPGATATGHLASKGEMVGGSREGTVYFLN
jgi:hypothetical protein